MAFTRRVDNHRRCPGDCGQCDAFESARDKIEDRINRSLIMGLINRPSPINGHRAEVAS